MAGTRLIVHATFVVELLLLVTASLLYASNQKHDPFSSAEPFLADQSGWQILVEDVSSPNDDVGVIGYIGGIASAALSQISSLMGLESEKPSYHDRPVRTSAFVQEMRDKIAQFGYDDNDKGGQSRVLPPSRVNLHVPQVTSSTVVKSLAASLERGFQSRSTKGNNFPVVRVGIAESEASQAVDSCDDFSLPILSKINRSHRELKFPEIILLMDCSSGTIPNQQSTHHVEAYRSDGLIVVRTKLSVKGGNKLQTHLEKEISDNLLSILFLESPSSEYRVGSVSIKLIDEDPTSHATDESGNVNGFTAKAHFDMIGKALYASVQKVVSPILEDLSFIYGGKIEVDNMLPMISYGSMIKGMKAIGQEVHSSAYLPLSDEIIEPETMDESSSTYVSSEGLANWLMAHTPLRRRHPHSPSQPVNVEWTLFVPAKEHTPLIVRDDSSGEEGESITLSPPSLTGESAGLYPNGMSIVNLESPSLYSDSNARGIDMDKVYYSYKDRILSSLVYLVGYIRAIHGLPTESNNPLVSGLSFWEMESIARSHYTSALETAFHETDTLLAVLHQHSWTLAFPQEVAHKLNNATHLLRQSISLVEQGYPTIYATSLLYGSLEYLESVQSDHQFHELPYFAPDHYLAVFSPLVLPLFLPMIVGLVREVKRFRELQKKKVT